MEHDTIAAVSSAVAESGIGIIRISGPDAFTVIDRIYRSKSGKKRLSEEKSHTIHYGFIVNGEEIIDEVLVMIMRAPRTYTAEDTVEINCHGGIYAMKQTLETVIRHGARPAEPGEFTKRAFLNGRIDLSQAEAVMDVIQSKNEYALKSSVSQLKGSVKAAVGEMREKILYHIAKIEAALDDPEHMSLDGYTEELLPEIREIHRKVCRLIDTADDGRILTEGIQTVIAGKPNAGKSSLMNMLMGEERAIVTDIAGTTRDVLEETINVRGITLRVTDTAGIRDTDDVVEKIGVGRAKEKMQEADLILYVADSSGRLDENDREIMEMLKGRKAIILLNKSDLPSVTTEQMLREQTEDAYPIVSVSAKTGAGMDRLEELLREMFYQGRLSFNNEICITNMRQKTLLQEAADSLKRAIESAEADMPEDFLSIDLRSAYEALGGITGETLGEDIVNEIFGRFCMGK
ncbi:MAG: tRNA uridine-5-carboxymethylaminomethyl(34) synthesis GTPase MnmE [Lachnospiraceae bacterium]|nr:tRNA uridine-5-carboxymethylaminomethyl(34) synthesis GTPase MnmE [Lachnospiraceae bacterium]